MNNVQTHIDMIKAVARALGEDLLAQVAFVGGSTTGLLITDALTREQVRGTDDIDLIVHVIGYQGFARLQKQLSEHGFRTVAPPPGETAPICAMKLGDLRVDFMPDDEKVLGFGNRWYTDALKTAQHRELGDQITIRLVAPPYFIATKLEAWLGRGNADALQSRDIEDIISLIDGRPELLAEMADAPPELQHYVALEIQQLLQDSNFEYAVQSQARNSQQREDLIFSRLETLAGATG